MDKYKKEILYALSLGALFAIFLTVNLYRHPIYNVDIVQSDFQLVTEEGISLGRAFSTISLMYKPDRDLGHFYVIIKTVVSEPYWRHSIISRDIHYRVSLLYKSSFVERLEGGYLGALNPNDGRTMYNCFTLPSFEHPMNSIRSVYGKMVLTFECDFYNVTSNKIFAENTEEFHIFIIHPNFRLVTFSLLITVSGIAILERSGPTYKVKNIWEKIKKRKKTKYTQGY